MKRPVFLVVFLFMICILGFSQSSEKQVTSYDQFVSQSGKIIRFQDYKLPPLKGSLFLYTTRIRVLKAGEKTTYYYQIIIKGKYSDVTGSIEENDLIEMAKALESLQISYIQDKKGSADYLENKYITNDGVQLGYYISGKDYAWYFDLDKNKSDSTAFFNDGEVISSAIKYALEKITLLRQAN
jgi:hypothetical protein